MAFYGPKSEQRRPGLFVTRKISTELALLGPSSGCGYEVPILCPHLGLAGVQSLVDGPGDGACARIRGGGVDLGGMVRRMVEMAVGAEHFS